MTFSSSENGVEICVHQVLSAYSSPSKRRLRILVRGTDIKDYPVTASAWRETLGRTPKVFSLKGRQEVLLLGSYQHP